MKQAKLTCPEVHDALRRPRLFAVLEDLRARHCAVWMAAPPGAGKTTLAASFVRESGSRVIWYQFDSSDSDPATLFHCLADAVREDGPPLPWLAPELLGDIPRFARLFFRQFYARLRTETSVVFDNVHDYPNELAATILETALTEAPDGVTLLVLSRETVPLRYSRLELSGRLSAIEWNTLRFDHGEARALAGLDDALQADPRVDAWLAKVDGWAAGVVMLREHLDAGAEPDSGAPAEPRGDIFDYFAGEIFERMPAPLQRLLMLLSCLPGMSAEDAHELTGDPGAARSLDQLFHKRWFVDRRGSATVTYHFHALFQEFLQRQAALHLAADERTQLLERAGAILSAQGRIDDAVRMYQAASAWHTLAALLESCGSAMLGSGRGHIWRVWLSSVPDEVADRYPWLSYWQGTSLNHVDALFGREVLTKAERAFALAGNVRAQLLTIAAIIDSYYYEWENFQQLHSWIDVMQGLLERYDADGTDADSEVRIHTRLVLALFFTRAKSPRLAASAERAMQLLPLVKGAADRLSAGAILLNFFNWGDAETSRLLIAKLNHLADDPAIAPFHRLSWWRPAIYRMQLDGQFLLAQEMIASARRLVADFGLTQFAFHCDLRLAFNYVLTMQLEDARRMIDEMLHALPPGPSIKRSHLRLLEAVLYSQGLKFTASRLAAEEANAIVDQVGMPAPLLQRSRIMLSFCCAQADDLDAALGHIDDASDRAEGSDRRFAEESGRFIRAYACLKAQDEAGARALLEQALQALRRRPSTLTIILTCFPILAGTLFAFALREAIEAEFVRELILRRSLPAPHRLTPYWPWPIGVRAFGKFELSLDGAVMAATGKAQQRPLALLKALMAAGGKARPQATLAALLWPDAEDGKSALNVTVHRLRKMLGNDGAVQVAQGRVLLSPVHVWCDTAAFSELSDSLPSAQKDLSTQQLLGMAANLFVLYRGQFCEGDDDTWLLESRERMRAMFVHSVEELGRRLELVSQPALAMRIYIQGLEREPLAEALYRSLMRSAHNQSDTIAAVSAYRRCRDTLLAMRGAAPSAETQALAVALGLK
ncbi:MAG TPA: BTAD domain-containing putative transcriptional regulator [Burkholderiaceae bacterium]